MIHFFKYFLFILFLFLILMLFQSNLATEVSLKFDLPLIFSWSSPTISINYLLLIAFCAGVLFSAAIGAFRLVDVRSKKRELREMERSLKEAHPLAFMDQPVNPAKDDLPSLANR